MLRIYYPAQGEFKIEHLLLEENLGHPILQLRLGFFIPYVVPKQHSYLAVLDSLGSCCPCSNQQLLAIAILHPHRLGVYAVEGVGGSGMAASYFKLTLRYEHLLGDDGEHFTAFNMIHGPFGSGTDASRVDKDHLCVQSLDGRLQFFDQDRFAFTQALNNSFLPGPICYAGGMDAIVAATSDLQIECYRYQVLASASLKQQKKPSALDSEAKATSSSGSTNSIHCDWKINLGESVLDIRTGRCYYQENTTTFDILVLGEFTLFAIKPHGELFLQHRLGGHPSTLCLYPRSAGEKASGAMENLIVASHSKIWSVYKAKTLIWSACAPTVPVAMHVAGFGPIDGMIVSLNGDGALSVNYMGTDPPTTAVVSTEVKEINYEVMDEEHRQLLHVIRRSQGEKRSEPKDRLLVRAQMPVVLDATSANGKRHHHQEFKPMSNISTNSDPNQPLQGAQVTMRIYVTSTSTSRISDVTLSISTPEHVVANETSFVLDSIDGKTTTPLIIPVVLRPSTIGAMPTTQDLVIAASYTLESGQPRVSQCRVKLPLCLIARLVPPVKSSTFKFTLETNQDPQELTQLFEDMLHQPFCTPEWAKQIVGGGTNVMSFQYYNGVDATILVSKNAGRYRIQSNELEALWMVSRELVDRLRVAFASRSGASDGKSSDDDGANGEPLEIFYQEPLPLADFFGAIDTHFMLRRQRLEISAEINDRAHQLRVIQKRLLVRYKDRNPAAIHCLDVLLHGTYDQLLTLSHSVEDVERRVALAGNRLACCVHLILLLIQFRFHLDDANAQLLACYLSPTVHQGGSPEGGSVGSVAEEQGWEERTEAAMTELLRTLLAKQQQSNATTAATTAAATNASDLQMPEDTKKLKKHITIVCDRLGKGASLCGGNAAPADQVEARA